MSNPQSPARRSVSTGISRSPFPRPIRGGHAEAHSPEWREKGGPAEPERWDQRDGQPLRWQYPAYSTGSAVPRPETEIHWLQQTRANCFGTFVLQWFPILFRDFPAVKMDTSGWFFSLVSLPMYSGAFNAGGGGEGAGSYGPPSNRGGGEKKPKLSPLIIFFEIFSINISKGGTLWKCFMAPPFKSS